eukprot:g13142.t1
MIIPVSIDKLIQAEAQGEEGAGGKDGQLKTEGVCVPEWSMVELQGELVSKDPMSGQPLGSMTSENGKPMLVIANHKLEGKPASEPKPLLVLRKVLVDVNDENSSGGNSGDGGVSGAKSEGGRHASGVGGGREGAGVGDVGAVRQPRQQRVEYRIVGRVTRKTIFKTRPKPLIRKLGDGDGRGGGSSARSCM